jgi:hypothetical protein
VQRALVGAWVGTLEYRDFSEPAASTKRVKLPAWATVSAAGADLRFDYVYDDGPGKTVKDSEVVRFDAATAGQLKEGRGMVVVMGSEKENDAPVETRTTWRIGRNIMEITEETAPKEQPFAFRHGYTFVRAAAPVVP